MPRALTFVLAASLVLQAPALAQVQCIRLEPDTAIVFGKLIRQTFPGPPDYESTAAGDRPETYFLLELPDDGCILKSRAPSTVVAVSGIALVQLQLDSVSYATLRPFLNRTVTVIGLASEGVSGHHHSPLQLRMVSWHPGLPRP